MDLASGRVFHQLLDYQLVNELVRCFVGVLRPPFLSLCVPGCCPTHDNLVKSWRTVEFFSMLLLPHNSVVSFCVWGTRMLVAVTSKY